MRVTLAISGYWMSRSDFPKETRKKNVEKVNFNILENKIYVYVCCNVEDEKKIVWYYDTEEFSYH